MTQIVSRRTGPCRICQSQKVVLDLRTATTPSKVVTISVCPRCDRMKCKRCDTVDMSGVKRMCCGKPLGVHA